MFASVFRSLRLMFFILLYSANILEHLIDVIDQSGAEDDLQLVAGHKDALNQIQILNRLQVYHIIVLQHNPKPCCAVCNTLNVFLASHQLCKLFGDGKISLSFLFVHISLL